MPGMSQSIERLFLTVADVTFTLAPTEHADVLKTEIARQVQSGGGFVDVTVDDGQRLSFLVTPTSVITIAARTVHLDTEEADGHRPAWDPGAPAIYDDQAPWDTI